MGTLQSYAGGRVEAGNARLLVILGLPKKQVYFVTRRFLQRIVDRNKSRGDRPRYIVNI
jgi:hypothetical protein